MTGSLGETPLSVFHDQLAVNFLGAVSVTKGALQCCEFLMRAKYASLLHMSC